mmetsp:Transcript_85431/g.160888  ORF Transcript_85431/g.160888 Transcript_85431/m.160888 type:complete len:548 (+) Transcript_85431:70-1713(+)
MAPKRLPKAAAKPKAKSRSPGRAKGRGSTASNVSGAEAAPAGREEAAAAAPEAPVVELEELQPLAAETPLDAEAASLRRQPRGDREDSEARRIERVLLDCLVTEDLACLDIRVLEISVLDARQLADGAVDAGLLARAERCLEEATELQAEQDDEEFEDPSELIEKLFNAINDFDAEVVQECFDANAGTPSQLPVDATDHEGNTALSEAACYGADELVMLLLQRRAHPDYRNNLGRTPLWRACYNGHLSAVELLLQHGADKDIPNNQLEAPGKFGTPETKAAVADWNSERTLEIKKELGLKIMDITEASNNSWMTSQARPKAKSGMGGQRGDDLGDGLLLDSLLEDRDKTQDRRDFAKRFSTDAAVSDVFELPAYPIKIELRQLSAAINTAHHFGKVPLIVCNGVDLPERFLLYTCEGIIDARQILSEVYFQKIKTVKEMQAELQLMLLQSMETHGSGFGLHVRMGTTACSFKGAFCAPGVFPAEVFGGSNRWNDKELRKHFPDPRIMIQPGFNLIVSTGYGMEEAMLHLPNALPYFDEMAIMEVAVE